MQEIKKEMVSDSNYSTIFPETLNILLTLPLGTASAEKSFSKMKLDYAIVSHMVLRAKLMRTIDGPEKISVNFEEVFKENFNFKDCLNN